MNPSELARETLRRLAQDRLPPTPDNYARVFAELSGQANAGEPPDASPAQRVLQVLVSALLEGASPIREAQELRQHARAQHWPAAEQSAARLSERLMRERTLDWQRLVRELLREWDERQDGLTQARKRESLEHVLTAFAGDPAKLHARLAGLVKAWSKAETHSGSDPAALSHPALSRSQTELQRSAMAPADADATASVTSPTASAEMLETLREVLSDTLLMSVSERLGYTPELAADARHLALQALEADSVRVLRDLLERVRGFFLKLEIRGAATDHTIESLRQLVLTILDNLGELVESESWVHGQIIRVRTLLENEVSSDILQAAERSLKEVLVQQGNTRLALIEARDALKSMVSTFIDRFGKVIDSTGQFSGRLSGYAERLQNTDDLPGLSRLMQEMLQDTRSVQADLVRSHEELKAARTQVEQAQQRAEHLEHELRQLSDTAKQDPLTRALNRRGLDQALETELARASRQNSPLCLVLLDIDNFKQINDRIGHQAGDEALRMLADSVRDGIRPTDVLARYGGEEFVILLPDTELTAAGQLVTRLQRMLTTRFFMVNDQRTFITFSAGVAQKLPGESAQSLIERADQAMLLAKRSGKNRVELAA